jgi:multidrug resistance efflux pump
MTTKLYLPLIVFLFFSCKQKVEKTHAVRSSITESIYASGIIKSKNQYQAFATVNGIISDIYVTEGDSVKKGSSILSISNETQKLNKENAELLAQYSDFNNNQDKLNEASSFIELSKNKMKIDSAMYFRQQSLWQQQVGTKSDLEQKELAYQNSKTNYYSSIVKYNELKRQLNFTSSQSKKNLAISSKQESDFTLRSEIDGLVYTIYKSKGEIVGLQTPLAMIGDATHFILEMQVDEYDIFKIRKGQSVQVSLDSYKGKVFEALVTKINPLMNERSKTFLIEAEFTKGPEVLYPNVTFEANIVLSSKANALLLPRNYLINDTAVLSSEGKTVRVQTGLKDYQKIEILSGISENDEIILPKQ